MLPKSSISSIEIHSEEWYAGRLATFTASEWHLIMGDKWPTETAIKYVYRKVGEEMTGIPCRDEIDIAATRHGLMNEAHAIRLFGQTYGINFVVTQKLIKQEGSRFGCTPDFLIINAERSDELSYSVFTGEVKCPITFDGYIGLFMCDTPDQVKRFSKAYYWQVLFQMKMCGALRGYLVVYHPDFKAGKMKVIEFKMIDLMEDFKLMAARMEVAVAMFEEVRNRILYEKPVKLDHLKIATT